MHGMIGNKNRIGTIVVFHAVQARSMSREQPDGFLDGTRLAFDTKSLLPDTRSYVLVRYSQHGKNAFESSAGTSKGESAGYTLPRHGVNFLDHCEVHFIELQHGHEGMYIKRFLKTRDISQGNDLAVTPDRESTVQTGIDA